jgi:hypothetical protein
LRVLHPCQSETHGNETAATPDISEGLDFIDQTTSLLP